MKRQIASTAQPRDVHAWAGFTLLEVVVATAILAIGVAVAMQVFSGGLSNLHRIEMAHRAMSHAENLMSELLADQDIRGPYHSSGDLDEDFFYEAHVDYWEDPDPSPAVMNPALPAGVLPQVFLLKITVRIEFKDPDNNIERHYQANCLKAVSEDQDDLGAGDQLRRTSDQLQRLLGRQR